eukprot:gb/GECH01007443.1/.p1 GENE.gb/GECH01007443.1/~~gb/GECH01007443.1/.p1  ORF type:complete len:423 (+),score=115.26 gb/GECH01007443.1/:1-1269(+)
MFLLPYFLKSKSTNMVEWERHKIQGNKIPEKCAGLSACVYKDQIYVFGGQYNINDDFFPIEQYYRELFVVNINDFSWRQIQCTPQKNWPTARSHHTALIYERSNHPQMCVFGGRCSEGRIFNGILTFDLEREEDHDAWKEDSPYHAPKGRYEHSAVIFGSKMIIFGGVYHLIDQEEEEYLSNNVHVYDLTDHRWEIYPELCPTNEDMVTNDVHSGLEKASIDNNNNDDDDDNEDNNNNNVNSNNQFSIHEDSNQISSSEIRMIKTGKHCSSVPHISPTHPESPLDYSLLNPKSKLFQELSSSRVQSSSTSKEQELDDDSEPIKVHSDSTILSFLPISSAYSSFFIRNFLTRKWIDVEEYGEANKHVIIMAGVDLEVLTDSFFLASEYQKVCSSHQYFSFYVRFYFFFSFYYLHFIGNKFIPI